MGHGQTDRVGAPLTLIVEGDRLLRAELAMVLRSAGMQTLSASTLAEGLSLLGCRPACVFVGQRLEDGDGIVLLRRVREGGLPTRVVVLAGGRRCDAWPVGPTPDGIFACPIDREQVIVWLRDNGLVQEMVEA